MKTNIFSVALLVSASIVSFADAQQIFTNRADFEAAIDIAVTEDFSVPGVGDAALQTLVDNSAIFRGLTVTGSPGIVNAGAFEGQILSDPDDDTYQAGIGGSEELLYFVFTDDIADP